MNISNFVKGINKLLTPDGVGTDSVDATRADEKQSRIEKDFDATAGQKLTVELISGAISIEGWERDVVSVRAHLADGDWSDYDVQFKQNATGLRVVCRAAGKKSVSMGRLKFEIKVPHRFNLEINLAGGDISVAHIEGEMKGTTMGGGMCLSDLMGKIEMTTMGGDVSLTDSAVSGKVETMSGQVLIKNVVGDVKAHSMTGSVVYENASHVVTSEPAGNDGEDVLRVSSTGGDVSIEDAPSGVEVTNSGGDIAIRSATGFLKARTNGGHIKVDAVDGWVDASTGGGDVEVRMVGDTRQGRRDVTLTSNGGDVRLTVPAELSANIEIELAYTNNSRQDYAVITDFDVQERRTGEWDASKGTPRKYIYATGGSGEGHHRIRIKTVNGNIYLNKSL